MYNNMYGNNDDYFIASVYGASIIQDNLMYNQIVAAFISQGMSSYEAGLAADRHFGIDRNATSYRIRSAISTGIIRVLCFIFIAPIVFVIIAIIHHALTAQPFTPGEPPCEQAAAVPQCPNYIAPTPLYP